MSTLFSFLIKSFKIIFITFSIYFYFFSFYFITNKLKVIYFEDSPIRETKLGLLSMMITYLVILFLFQKIHLRKKYLKSLLFASIINLSIIILTFIIINILLITDNILIDIPIESSVPYISSFNNSGQISKDISNLTPEKIIELKQVISIVIICVSIILITTLAKTSFIIWKLRKNYLEQ